MFYSKTFRIYFVILVVFCCIGANVTYTDNLRATKIGSDISSSLQMLCIFTLTSFLGHVISKVNTRFENVCKTNGYVTRLSALAVSLYSKEDAWTLMRYTNVSIPKACVRDASIMTFRYTITCSLSLFIKITNSRSCTSTTSSSVDPWMITSGSAWWHAGC